MKERRQKLRRESPKAEVLLWQRLKGRQIGGHKFRRQYSVGGYVVDFYCAELRLAIEIDGPTHYRTKQAKVYDERRQQFIEQFGIKIVRFSNHDIYNNIDGVLNRIINHK